MTQHSTHPQSLSLPWCFARTVWSILDDARHDATKGMSRYHPTHLPASKANVGRNFRQARPREAVRGIFSLGEVSPSPVRRRLPPADKLGLNAGGQHGHQGPRWRGPCGADLISRPGTARDSGLKPRQGPRAHCSPLPGATREARRQPRGRWIERPSPGSAQAAGRRGCLPCEALLKKVPFRIAAEPHGKEG